MRTALCLGGGATLPDDLAALKPLGIEIDGVFACNDAAATWDGELEGMISLHPEKMPKWLETRRMADRTPPKKLWAHRSSKHGPDVLVTTYMFPAQKTGGSSGLFTAKVALVDEGYDRAILCGIPMDPIPHFFDRKDWKAAEGFRRGWLSVSDSWLCKMRSMSGWTRVLLGGPDDWKDPIR